MLSFKPHPQLASKYSACCHIRRAQYAVEKIYENLNAVQRKYSTPMSRLHRQISLGFLVALDFGTAILQEGAWSQA